MAESGPTTNKPAVPRWWVCRCGRPLYEHARHKVPSAGIEEYVCLRVVSGRFEPETLPGLDYTPQKGLHSVRGGRVREAMSA